MEPVHDAGTNKDVYDTDSISLTSTVEDDTNQFWDAEEILAEGEDSDGLMRFLIKWDGFSFGEATWEPYEHIEGTSLPQHWEDWKSQFSEDKLDALIQDTIRRHDCASEKVRADKRAAAVLRKEKRAKKREKLHQQQGAAASAARNESESDDDIPLVGRRKHTDAHRITKEETVEVSPLFVRETQKPRKLPFEQSSSSSGEENSDSSSLARTKSKETNVRTTKQGLGTERSRQSPPSQLGSLKATEKQLSPTSKRASSRAQGLSEQDIGRHNQACQLSTNISSTSPPHEQRQKAPATGSKIPSQQEPQANSAASPTITTKPSADSASFTQSRKPSSSTQATATSSASSEKPAKTSIRRSALGSQPGPIKMVNQRPTTTRKPWHNSDKQYHTLMMRHNAEKRSRDERTPDISALEFVNGSPGSTTRLPGRTRAREDNNPYSRREMPRRRSQYEACEERRSESPPAWEADKVPLTCWEWRNGSCWYRAEQCKFLHRDTPHVSPADGTIPPKFKRPPVTCWWWMEGLNGCEKSEDQCGFAHRNTGWLGLKHGGLVSQIDSNKPPKFEQLKMEPRQRKHPKFLTCFYWAQSTCRYSEETCQYAHRDTGELANPPPGWKPRRGSANNFSLPGARYPALGPSRRTSDGQERMSSLSLRRLSMPGFSHSYHEISKAPAQDNRMATDSVSKPPPVSVGSDMDDQESAVSTAAEEPTFIEASSSPPALEDSNANDAKHDLSIPLEVDPIVLKDPAAQPPTRFSCADLKETVEDALKLDFDKMFVVDLNDKLYLDRLAFLFFHPEEHKEEMELMVRWLLMHHVEVCCFWRNGSWDYFKQKTLNGGSGIIIAHPDFDSFHAIPDFGKVLRSLVRVWSVGYQLATEYDPRKSTVLIPPRIDCIEIFPHGGFIYVTDAVFEERAQEALELVRLFVDKVDTCRSLKGPVDPFMCVDDGCLLWRLGTRPELMSSIYDWCMDHIEEIDAMEPNAQSRAQLWELLHDCGYIDKGSELSSDFISQPDDYWPIISDRREVKERYFDALFRNKEEAMREELQYFSELIIDMRRDYRKLIVVHTAPSEVAKWQDDLQHIDEIMTPEECIKYLQQPAAPGNRIDFMDWMFTRKERMDSMDIDNISCSMSESE